jgi:hypothetical protein
MNWPGPKLISLGLLFSAALAARSGLAQLPDAEPPERMQSLSGNFIGQTDRPLRYFPVGGSFVITNGAEFFNRPLYGNNTAFRVDGGDKPEFSLYLPGRGGNLRFGIKTPAGVKWLNDAEQVITRYRAGSLLYEIRDPLLGRSVLGISLLPLSEAAGIVARAELRGGGSGVELLWAFGGANGMRGRRGGDIGCEREPVGDFFQLRPDQCKGNEFFVATNSFVLHGKPVTIAGISSPGATHAVADASKWSNATTMLASIGATNELPVVVGRIALSSSVPVFLALQPINPEAPALREGELAKAFAAAEARQRAIADRVVVETPDEFINAAAAALNVAADGVWDAKQTSFMHGAVAWRNRLLGWRGAYAGDALGWHERTRQHLEGFAKQQNTNPAPDRIPEPEESANLSRNENALHSNGNLSKNHYDMNLVAMDALFRHLLWTGDLEFAKQMWPVIERHLAWERRLLRREFGPDKLPLYEGYANFWASDDVAYNGGGSAQASAYNFYHNKMAARVAKLIGKDATPYECEAGLIAKAMRSELWLPERGWFAEYKDWLGLQLVHPNAAAWTFYHTIDSEVPTPDEALRMTRWVETEVAHIPVSGPNVPPGCFTIPTSSWMPYAWSVNNVVMAEATHTALACWQANRRELAFPLFKGALLDSMFLGLCPGNVGMCTQFDAYRHESQRDFADGVGATSRALIEGLFGIKPDALAGELVIRPGFPAEWDHANIRHPDLNFTFRREGSTETFVVEQEFSKPMKVRLQLAVAREKVEGVIVNGKPVSFAWFTNLPASRYVEVEAIADLRSEVVVNWSEAPVSGPARQKTGLKRAGPETDTPAKFDWNAKRHLAGTTDAIDLASVFNDTVRQIFRNEYLSPRSPFCSLALPKQGIGSWCLPKTTFEVDDSGLRTLARKGAGKFTMPNGVTFVTPGEADAKNIAFVSQWNNYPHEVSVPLKGKSSRAFLLMAGSTNPMQTGIDNGEVIVTYADGSTARLPLRNPTTWWPIEQDYFIDDYAFRYDGLLPPRVDLKTGKIRVLEMESFKGKGGKVPGGAATVLNLPLDPAKELKSLTVRALANEVVIGLMSLTLER